MSLAPDRSSLPRVLEPEAMDSAEEARDYDTMDHTAVNQAFAADFLEALGQAGLPDDIVALDLGTGTAQIPIELCRQSPRIRVRAVDLSAEMLRLAGENVARASLGDRIELEHVDAKGLPHADGAFAAVISNSIVHHVPDPADVLGEAVRVLAQPGIIFVRDLARPQDDASVRRLVATYAGDCTPEQRKLFDDSLRAALAVDEVRDLVERLGFDRTSVRANSDRHWTWCAVTGRAA